MLVLKQGNRVGLGSAGCLLGSRGRAIARAICDITRACLSDSGRGKMDIVLVNGGLHLFQNLVNRGQITPSLCVAHGRQAVSLNGIF